MFVRKALYSSVAAMAVLLGATVASAQVQTIPSDERTELAPGIYDAAEASSGLALEHTLAPPPGFFDPDAIFAPPTTREEAAAYRANPPRYSPLALANSDMAVSDGKLFVGNFNGFNIYDISGGGEPQLLTSVVCPGGQGDVSVHGNLLFMSVEQNNGRIDCGASGADGAVNPERFRGVRIFDISNIRAPQQVAAVQTCRGSHTHTLVPNPADSNILYVYNSATSGVRRSDELSICSDGEPGTNPDTALYSIDVIEVPLDRPQDAAIVNRPRIFEDRETGAVAGLWMGGRAGVASQATARTNHCHDITVFPEIGQAAGACSGNGILLDISDPKNPQRISEIFDADMAYWHSATFDNTGSKVVFTDEWGGGTSPRCTADAPGNWGANLVATITNGELRGRAFHKLPSVQGSNENCVAHNGNIIPVPGRDLMVQAWYQGGISIMDFTDPMNPMEIAYFDRGPLGERLMIGGSWSAYWFNGRIYSSEIARGLDVLRLLPSDQLSAAEIAAAEAVMEDEINPQTQTRVSWANTPDVAGAYLDQLKRADAIDAALAGQVSAVIDGWRAGRIDAVAAASVVASLTASSETQGVAPLAGRRMKALAEVLASAAG